MGAAGAGMHSVTGFSTGLFEKVWEDSEFVISRGRRDGDGLPVLLLMTSPEAPIPANPTLLRQACALREELDSAWAARPLELVEFRGHSITKRSSTGPDENENEDEDDWGGDKPQK